MPEPRASPDPGDIAESLKRRIAAGGPIAVADYMAAANAHYYATRDPFGPEGDFVTAPEISQMFGELIGIWCADLWLRAGRPARTHYVELGPGRGTLAHDALRAMAGAGLVPDVALVETSPVLRRAQAEAVPAARWHDDVDTLPADGPLLVVANEFFDALPLRQFENTDAGWRERLVDVDEGRFVAMLGKEDAGGEFPARFSNAAPGDCFETCLPATGIAGSLAARIVQQGGAMLVIDYGHPRTSIGDTLQAVERHGFAEVFDAPGARDLTAHVDFEALGDAARTAGANVCGPRAQGEWLTAMGINARAAMLAKCDPASASEHAEARARLVGPESMGRLFKVMAATAPNWPQPEGF